MNEGNQVLVIKAIEYIRHFFNDFELILVLKGEILPYKDDLLSCLLYCGEGVVLLHVHDSVSAIFYHYLLYFLNLFHIYIITTNFDTFPDRELFFLHKKKIKLLTHAKGLLKIIKYVF